MAHASSNQNNEVCIATPIGRGAVATVLARGEGLGRAMSTYFRAFQTQLENETEPELKARMESSHYHPPTKRDAKRHRFGTWVVNEFREEVVLHHPTANHIEIHCHGGIVPSREILRSFVALGFEPLEWSDWFSNQSISTIEVEAIESLSRSCTEQTACILLDQLNGALKKATDSIGERIRADDWDEASRRVDRLCNLIPIGNRLLKPATVVIAGPANAGKSSLLNACLGFTRSIVYDQPGTTRDAIHVLTAVDGWPFMLVDTAGMRTTEDDIESAGVKISKELAKSADLVLAVTDLSSSEIESDDPVAELANCAQIRVGTKADIATDSRSNNIDIATSSVTEDGIPELLQEIRERLIPIRPHVAEAVPFTSRQFVLLDELRKTVRNENRDGSLKVIEELTGGGDVN